MILSLLLALQTTPSDKLPPANPIPYADTDATAVLAPIEAMFRAMAANDAAGVMAQVRAEGGATAIADGAPLRHYRWAEFAALFEPGAARIDEHLNDPAIEVDGDLAMVWSPYTAMIDGKPHHCGVDHVDLVRTAGQWKVLNLTWSSRTEGCGAG